MPTNLTRRAKDSNSFNTTLGCLLPLALLRPLDWSEYFHGLRGV